MTGDRFEADLVQEPERLEAEFFAADGGGRYWPNLAFALPMGFRPLMMDLTVPGGPGPHPLVVFIHGGGWMLGTPKYSNPTLRKLGMMERLHAAGHAVARISYRLSGEAHWPAQLHDCKAAIRYLRRKSALFGLDAGRFAVLGESAGGHLAAMVALTGDDPAWEGSIGIAGESSSVRAAINWYGAVSLPLRRDGEDGDASPAELLVGAKGEKATKALRAASPLAHVHPAAPPFLHQHGNRDRMVPVEQAEWLHAALLEAGVPSELDIVEGADHCFWGATSPAIMDRVLRFLQARL